MSGCLNMGLEVDETLAIQGMAIDYDKMKKEIKLTMEVYDVAKSTGIGESESGNLTRIIESSGKTVYQAISNIVKIEGKTPVYSNMRVVVLSEEICKNGIDTIIDFFLRDYKTRSNLSFCMTRDFDAASIIKADEGDTPFPSDRLQELLEFGELTGYCCETSISEITRNYHEKTSSIFMPCITLKIISGSAFTQTDGTAIFNDGKVAGYLDDVETRGMMFITNKIKRGSIYIKNSSKDKISLEIDSSKTDVDLSIIDNNLSYTVNVKTYADICEVETDNNSELTDKMIKEIDILAEEYIYNSINSAVKKCFIGFGSDPFLFGRRLYLFHPLIYKDYKDKWDDKLKYIDVIINTNVIIKRTGQDKS